MLELTQCLCPWVNPVTVIMLVTIQQRRAVALKKETICQIAMPLVCSVALR